MADKRKQLRQAITKYASAPRIDARPRPRPLSPLVLVASIHWVAAYIGDVNGKFYDKAPVYGNENPAHAAYSIGQMLVSRGHSVTIIK